VNFLLGLLSMTSYLQPFSLANSFASDSLVNLSFSLLMVHFEDAHPIVSSKKF